MNIIDAITFKFYLLNYNNNILVIINICFLFKLIKATMKVSGLILTPINFAFANVYAINSSFFASTTQCIAVFFFCNRRRPEVISLSDKFLCILDWERNDHPSNPSRNLQEPNVYLAILVPVKIIPTLLSRTLLKNSNDNIIS